VPPRRAAAAPAVDRGVLVLEEKLRILTEGRGRGQRNPALDVLTGRVSDDRVQVLMASRAASAASVASAATGPTAMVLPIAAIRMAAVAHASRPAPSPWLRASADVQPRLRLVEPPRPRWARLPLIGAVLSWLRAEYRPYTWRARSPRAHPAS
jgi:hypothetical protein